MWWMDRSQSLDGRVGAAALCKHGDRWKAICSHLRTGQMVVYDAELWVIRLALQESMTGRKTLPIHGLPKVAVFSDSQAPIRGM